MKITKEDLIELGFVLSDVEINLTDTETTKPYINIENRIGAIFYEYPKEQFVKCWIAPEFTDDIYRPLGGNLYLGKTRENLEEFIEKVKQSKKMFYKFLETGEK